MRITTLLATACASLAFVAGAGTASAAEPGVSFSHKDWSVDCDNTGTCRAAGYQRDDDENAVSVLLTRAAGPGAPVTAKVQFGSFNDDGTSVEGPVRMSIGGHAAGTVVDSQDVSPAQVAALLKAFTGSAAVSFAAGDSRWRLSGDGAAAVLLKMDDVQGRVGTPGALVKKGAKPESAVPGPVKPPVIQAVRVPASVKADLPLALKVLATIAKTDDCDELESLRATKQPDTSDVDLWRLGGGRVLVTTLCWRGAYNAGNGYWVANDKPPYDAKFVTAQADTFDPATGDLSGSAKGRGPGDCLSSESWVWNGREFVHATVATTGMCRMVAPGGAWDLPTLVSEVRKPR